MQAAWNNYVKKEHLNVLAEDTPNMPFIPSVSVVQTPNIPIPISNSPENNIPIILPSIIALPGRKNKLRTNKEGRKETKKNRSKKNKSRIKGEKKEKKKKEKRLKKKKEKKRAN